MQFYQALEEKSVLCRSTQDTIARWLPEVQATPAFVPGELCGIQCQKREVPLLGGLFLSFPKWAKQSLWALFDKKEDQLLLPDLQTLP